MDKMALLSFSSHLLIVCTLCHDSFRALPPIFRRAWLLQSSSYNLKNPFRNSKSSEFELLFFSLCVTALIIPIFPGAKGATDLMEGESQSALWGWGGHRRWGGSWVISQNSHQATKGCRWSWKPQTLNSWGFPFTHSIFVKYLLHAVLGTAQTAINKADNPAAFIKLLHSSWRRQTMNEQTSV